MGLPSYSRGYAPGAAGAQNPGKYPFTGKNYAIWGEQPGWLYIPWQDKYVPDPAASKSYGESTGLIEKEKKPKTVSASQQLLAQAGLAAAPVVAKTLTSSLFGGGTAGEGAKAAVGGGSSFADTLKGLLGIGGGDGAQGAGASVAGSSAAATPTAAELEAMGVSNAGEVTGLTGAAPMFGSGGTLFNTEGMIGSAGSFAPLNIAGAAAGGYGVYDATKKQNKRAGVTQGALSGAAAGMSIGGPWGAGIGAVVGGLLGLTSHESTKHRSNRRYDELSSTSTDAAFQKLLSEGREMSLAGKDTWDIGDDKASAPLDLMSKSYGVLKAFGPSWANYSADQQRKVLQEMVNADMINNKQGEWLVDDVEGANKILTSIAGAPAGGASATTGTTTGTSAGTTQEANTEPSVEDLTNVIPWVDLQQSGSNAAGPVAPVQAPAVDQRYQKPNSMIAQLLANQAAQGVQPLTVQGGNQGGLLGNLLKFS